MTGEKVTFSFGKNWERFVRDNFSEERVEISKSHILGFLGRSNLGGLYFLDVGCGSGIHSLAALKAGAARVVGFDVDPHSVGTAEAVRDRVGSFPHWEVRQGSILDEAFLQTVEPADIVYSWGVLHHTGDLWRAVRNAAGLVKEGGLFYIALYERTEMSDHWIEVKKRYNRAAPFGKKRMEWGHVYRHFFAGRGPRGILRSVEYIRTYRKIRGMEFWTDIRDWLGGWPYEPATPEEVTSFCRDELGLRPVTVKTGEANVEYLFANDGARR